MNQMLRNPLLPRVSLVVWLHILMRVFTNKAYSKVQQLQYLFLVWYVELMIIFLSWLEGSKGEGEKNASVTLKNLDLFRLLAITTTALRNLLPNSDWLYCLNIYLRKK